MVKRNNIVQGNFNDLRKLRKITSESQQTFGI